MFTLGISAFYHDSAAALLKDGLIVAAAQEERFTRKKHDAGFPEHAIRYCLEEANITPDELSDVVFYEKPFLKFERILETYLAFAPRGFLSFSASLPVWVKDKLFQKSQLIQNLSAMFESSQLGREDAFLRASPSHAASAFIPLHLIMLSSSQWTECEWATTSLALARSPARNAEGNRLYSLYALLAFTYFAGFKVNSGEYKLMGLAPYGEPKYASVIKDQLIEIAEDGSFRLNLDYFDYPTGLRMTNSKFAGLFGGRERAAEAPLTQREMDLAASVQQITEEIVIKLAAGARNETGERYLCLAGGVALNCVANGQLQRSGLFDDIWIQPAAGDAGGAVGAAFVGQHLHHSVPRARRVKPDNMQGAYLGPTFSSHGISQSLDRLGAHYRVQSQDDLLDAVAERLAAGDAVGWMQGRMEFGPRALGNRSILADPRSIDMQKQLNLKIKFRESFRPFAPSVLAEEARNWFELEVDSPYMLLVADVHRRITQKNHRQRLCEADLLNVNRRKTRRNSCRFLCTGANSAQIY